MKKVQVILIGAGSRGTGYAEYAQVHPDQMELVAVAEPRALFRERIEEMYELDTSACHDDWQSLLARPKFADAVFICTQDKDHLAPCLAALRKGYHVLLEKPMDLSEAGCKQISDLAIQQQVILGVCHVARYSDPTLKIQQLIEQGRIGELMSIQRLEPVGYWHMAHSYVRGNWRKNDDSSSILMAKSCHDIDWIRMMMAEPCTQVQSFGSLSYFKPEQAPKEATPMCVNCSLQTTCEYSATRIYGDRLKNGELAWPLDVLHPYPTKESIQEALENGPYGRCVFMCDNDVMDQQVVNMQFQSGKTATFTLSAFTPHAGRRTLLMGTKGMIDSNDQRIILHGFYSNTEEEVWNEKDFQAGTGGLLSGHGGADYRLMQNFIKAVQANDQSILLSGPKETLESHLIVFAAEQSRKTNQVIQIQL